MVDIAVAFSSEIWTGDWWLAADGTMATQPDMETAVLLSLFTNRTARPDDVIPDGGSIRGWWADAYRRYPLGSRMWLLWREKQTETTRLRAAEYARESLQWLIDCGAARTANTKATWVAMGVLQLDIEITPPAGERQFWRYTQAWPPEGSQL